MNQKNVTQFTEYLEKKGYSYATVESYARVILQIPDYWNTLEIGVLYQHINSAIKNRNDFFTKKDIKSISPALHQYFQMLTGYSYKAYGKEHRYDSSDFKAILSDFYNYSINYKHISDSSATAETEHIFMFLKTLNLDLNAINEISAYEIRDYANKILANLAPSSVGRYITSVRNFFRFLEYKGYKIHQSVFQIPLVPPNWGNAKVPVILSDDEVQRLRNHYIGTDIKDIRNKIIILLMLDFGLRCAEVANINISDIHWTEGVLVVNNTKNFSQRIIPLSSELGSLMEKYVMLGRPNNPDGFLFLRKAFDGTYIPMSKDAIRGVVRRALASENIQGWWIGTHSLRRTIASKVYNCDNSLKITADILGHKSIDSTKQYVKIDLNQLAIVASCWPGGDSCE